MRSLLLFVAVAAASACGSRAGVGGGNGANGQAVMAGGVHASSAHFRVVLSVGQAPASLGTGQSPHALVHDGIEGVTQ
jgi:hypothetical protein